MFRRRRQQVVEAAPSPDPDPAAAEQGDDTNAPPPGSLMGDSLWAPGTRRGLRIRLVQALLAAAAIAFMASTDGYNKFTAFRHLTAAMTLQCIWCLSLVAVDVSALLINQSFRTLVAACIGDLVTGTLTFIGASGSAAIIVVIHDTGMWSENQYRSFTAATRHGLLELVRDCSALYLQPLGADLPNAGILVYGTRFRMFGQLM